MKTNSPYKNPTMIVKIGTGTTGVECLVVAHSHEQIRGLSFNQRSQTISYDGQNVDNGIVLPTVDKNFQYNQPPPNGRINAGLGDYESRIKLVKSGKLWMVDKDFAVSPGILDKNIGVGGNVLYGRALFQANVNQFAATVGNAFRSIFNYDLQLSSAHSNVGSHKVSPAVDILIIASTAGGTGPGSVFQAIETVAQTAYDLKINVKITPIILLLGTLDPGDKKNANLNQLMTLKNLLVRYDGKYKEPCSTNGHCQPVVQPPIFVSNCNNHGELSDLKKVESVVARFLDLLCYEPFGQIFFREIINLHDKKQKDLCGANCIGSTIGLSAINLNIEKVAEFLTLKQVFDFFDELLKSCDLQQAQKHANAVFESLSLKETHSQDLAVQNLLSARNTNYKNASERAVALFRNGVTTSFGFRACEEIHHASKDIRQRQLPAQFIPAIRKEPEMWFTEIDQAFKSVATQYSQSINGICHGAAFWEEILRVVIESEKITHQKLADTVLKNKSLRNSVSQCERNFTILRKRHPILRALSFGLKSNLKNQYPRYTETLIQNELELAAQKLLVDVIFPTVKKAIIAHLELVNSEKQKALFLRQYYQQNSQRIKDLDNWLYCPNGVEHADEEFLEKQIQLLYDDQENKGKAMKKMFDMFCGKFNGLAALNTIDEDKIKTALYKHCKLNSLTAVTGLNAYDVTLERFPTEQQRYELICKMIAQSDGMVKISGEHNDDIPGKKYVCAPDEKTAKWAATLANSISRQGGDWTYIICEGLSGIYFVQYRTLISIRQLITDTTKLCNVPASQKELVKLAEDPFVITTPSPGCDIS
ncbi:MAG: hypothetical protein H8D47_04425, partial [Planctomycetes bacterium]|nr:hypothetical protein [Planctomycetota bacterium]